MTFCELTPGSFCLVNPPIGLACEIGETGNYFVLAIIVRDLRGINSLKCLVMYQTIKKEKEFRVFMVAVFCIV